MRPIYLFSCPYHYYDGVKVEIVRPMKDSISGTNIVITHPIGLRHPDGSQFELAAYPHELTEVTSGSTL